MATHGDLGLVNGRRRKDSISCIHDENGQVLVDEVEVIERWEEHFKGLYRDMERTDQEVPHSGAAEEDDLEITEEVRGV